MANSGQHRVVFWGIGAIGTELLTAILDHRRDLQIVGARVYSPNKNGVKGSLGKEDKPTDLAARF